MVADINVRVFASALIKAGRVPSLTQAQLQAPANALRMQYAATGPHYAVWGQDLSVSQVGRDAAVVRINNPILRHKISGGVIVARKGYLTIPLVPEAEGVPARSFPNLVALRTKAGNLILAETTGGEVRPVYALKKAVNQPPEDRAQPDTQRMAEAFHAAVDAQIRAEEAKSTGQLR
jgi:hypothetical protein